MPVDIVKAIREAGVVGAGGAGFPTHVKIGSKAGCVIINGAECEPLLRVDQQLMRERAKELLQGLSMLLDAVSAGRGVVALKGKYAEAAKELAKQVDDPRIEIFELGDFYPAGDEQVLVREITGRSVPEAGIPLQVDCIVDNVETVLNIFDAAKNKTVVDTWLTITGEVAEPLTCRIPVGTSMREALAVAGVDQDSGLALLEGGPMMGKLVDNWDAPVTKITKGLIVLPENHYLITSRRALIERDLRRARSVCMQCARCSDMCPRHLLGHGIRPHRLMRAVAYSLEDLEAVRSAGLCTECGACEYACPAGLSPRRVNAKVKAELAAAGVRYQNKGNEPQASPYREYRKIPVKRLVSRLGLKKYDFPAPLKDVEFNPTRVVIPLRQHIGKACEPVVKVGEQVRRGQLIGEIPQGQLGARVHASIDGVVVEQDGKHVVIDAMAKVMLNVLEKAERQATDKPVKTTRKDAKKKKDVK